MPIARAVFFRVADLTSLNFDKDATLSDMADLVVCEEKKVNPCLRSCERF
jgi:hypothetical protein